MINHLMNREKKGFVEHDVEWIKRNQFQVFSVDVFSPQKMSRGFFYEKIIIIESILMKPKAAFTLNLPII